MANNEEFNPELDKITEREVVYDFVNRLRIGRSIQSVDSYNNYTLFSPPEKLENILARLAMANNEDLAANIGKLYTMWRLCTKGSTTVGIGNVTIDIEDGQTSDYNSLREFFNAHIKYKIVFENTGDVAVGANISPSFTLVSSSKLNIALALQFEAALLNDTPIKIYLWYKPTTA